MKVRVCVCERDRKKERKNRGKITKENVREKYNFKVKKKRWKNLDGKEITKNKINMAWKPKKKYKQSIVNRKMAMVF